MTSPKIWRICASMMNLDVLKREGFVLPCRYWHIRNGWQDSTTHAFTNKRSILEHNNHLIRVTHQRRMSRATRWIKAVSEQEQTVPEFKFPKIVPSSSANKPSWLRVVSPGGSHTRFQTLKDTISSLDLHTVCEEAKCPNIGECWNGGTATVMLLGDTCTRGCRFCAVRTSPKPPAPDAMEPFKVAQAVASWGIDYVVLTSVDRDDMVDGGADHFARTVELLKLLKPNLLRLAHCGMDVFAHNLETVERLQRFVRDNRANYGQSLETLQLAKEWNPKLVTKSSIMLGLGETQDEIEQTMMHLRAMGVDALTLGQYLRPTERHLQVVEYVTPERFAYWEQKGLEMGICLCCIRSFGAILLQSRRILYEEYCSRKIMLVKVSSIFKE
eukprot:jgi/Galph1/1401/GphlegSOOS_G91.1